MQITEVAGYRLAERIGAGGMGDVFKAFHPALNRVAAVKILHQKEMSERFKNEAYIQSTVTHPNIARLYNYSVVADVPCIVMEFVEGETLDALLRRRGKLPGAEAQQIILQVAQALAYLHEKGILHRDIKPQNFKMQSDGTVKMLDFGIAKNKYTPKLTQLGFVVGTTEYMAPEQFENNVELKSDVWSLAVMSYELVTGYMPFEASNTMALRSKIMKSVYTHPRILVPDISETLQLLVTRNLRSQPSQRMAARDIVKLLNGAQSTAFPSVRLPKLPGVGASKWLPQKKTAIYTGLFIVAFICVTLIFSKTTPAQQPENEKVHVTGTDITLKIDVPGIEDAVIVLPDGSRQPVPYDLTGKEGETVSFTLHADGYADKTVLVDFTSHRSSYEYNLEKLKE